MDRKEELRKALSDARASLIDLQAGRKGVDDPATQRRLIARTQADIDRFERELRELK